MVTPLNERLSSRYILLFLTCATVNPWARGRTVAGNAWGAIVRSVAAALAAVIFATGRRLDFFKALAFFNNSGKGDSSL